MCARTHANNCVHIVHACVQVLCMQTPTYVCKHTHMRAYMQVGGVSKSSNLPKGDEGSGALLKPGMSAWSLRFKVSSLLEHTSLFE